MGSFSLDGRAFDEMIANFDAINVDTLVDYEHNSLNPFAVEAPASGWITALQRRNGDAGAALYARIEWTPRAADRIRGREYRYLSPVIRFHTPDRVSGADTGASIPSVALTNVPFLDELPEVTLNRSFSWAAAARPNTTTEESVMDPKDQAAIAVALGLSPDASPQVILDAARGQRALAIDHERIARTLGLGEDVSPDVVHNTVRAIKATQVPAAELAQLREQAAAATKLAADARLAKARGEGKITAELQPWAAELALKDPDAFDRWAAVAPKVVPVGTEIKPPTEPQPTDAAPQGSPQATDPRVLRVVAALPADEREQAVLAGLSVEDYVRHNLDELEQALSL